VPWPLPGKCEQGRIQVYDAGCVQLPGGRQEDIIKKLEKDMKEAADNLEFERAARIRTKSTA